jgi:hypothetical protein
MSSFRFASIPSNAAVATAVTLAVSAWFTVAAGTILADRTGTHPAEAVQHAVLMEEAAPASPTPIPVADAGVRLQPVACQKIVVEAQRIRVS